MLFTIGTSNRTPKEFFRELVDREVWLLVDVRSSPLSRLPWATGGALAIQAAKHGIEYAWSGRVLGGRNPIPTTHRDFEVSAEAVLDATDRGPVAMFCAEGDPATCHRSWKVAAHLLAKHGFVTSNILRSGAEEDVGLTLTRTRSGDIPTCVRSQLAGLSR